MVAKEKFTQFDFDMTVKLQNHISRRFDFLFSILSVIGSLEITGIIWVIMTGYVLIRKFFWTFLTMFLLPFALALELFGKTFVYHPAPPFLFYRGVIDFNFLPSTYIQTDYSYPSGHMTRTAFLVVFLMAYFHFRLSTKYQLPLQIGLTIFIILMGVSRIYLAEHWTTDVVGGILIGAATGLFCGLTVPKKSGSSINSGSI